MGRQEDAHEYLIGLLDAMHEGQLEGLKPKPSRSLQETSMIFRIFAGRIRSQVQDSVSCCISNSSLATCITVPRKASKALIACCIGS